MDEVALVRVPDDIVLLAEDDHASVVRDGEEIAVLPGAGPVVSSLISLLTGPRDRNWLRSTLNRTHPPHGGAVVDALLAEEALVPWPLADRLAAVHARTVAGGLSEPASPMADAAFLLREYHGEEVIDLPRPTEPAGGLVGALDHRRSARNLTGESLALNEVATLLAWGAGTGRGRGLPHVAGGVAGHRTYPSGGALYMIETYVAATSVHGLDPGSYRYQALPHRLAWARPAPDLARWLPDCPVSGIAAVVALAVDFARPSLSRYGEKAYRLALLEAGHIAQSVALVSATMGIGVLPLCGFDDDFVAVSLGLSPPHSVVVYVLALGRLESVGWTTSS